MKKVIIGFLIGIAMGTVMTVGAEIQESYTAYKASFSILVNGREFISEKPVVVIDGSTYLPLKALGNCLGQRVVWNDKLKRVEIGEELKDATIKYESNYSNIEYYDFFRNTYKGEIEEQWGYAYYSKEEPPSWVFAEFAIEYKAETNQMYLEVDEYSTIKDALEGKETVFYNTLIQLFGNDMPGVLNLIDHMWHEVEDDSITKDLECKNNNVTIHSSKGVNNKVILRWEAINNVQ